VASETDQPLTVLGPPADQDRFDRLRTLTLAAEEFIHASKAANTLRGYRSDWNDFTGWCAAHYLTALPAEPMTVALYLADLASSGVSAATIQRRVSSISQAHQAAGHRPSPTSDFLVRQVMRGIRRTLGTAPRNQKTPIAAGDLRRLVATCPAETMAGRRDRALLLVGDLGAFRRSELVGLDADDVIETDRGLRILLRQSKTDPEGEGLEKGIPRKADSEVCPVRALRAWRDAAGIQKGPLWRAVNRHDQVLPGRLSDRGVALVVKRACLRAGLDPDRYAGHSLRSGFATSAAEGGAPERTIMRQGGWTSEAMVRRYIRMADLFKENAAEYVNP
jgi:site-specific recombinase XerD